jgi:hypothetical protein
VYHLPHRSGIVSTVWSMDRVFEKESPNLSLNLESTLVSVSFNACAIEYNILPSEFSGDDRRISEESSP